jgi:R3H-associated N-terminal domain
MPSHDFVETSLVDALGGLDETVERIQNLRIASAPETVRRSAQLSIPLDAVDVSDRLEKGDSGTARLGAKNEARPHEPRRRDSLKRREALLKGKEGSRRRQRWENGKAERSNVPSAL